MDKIGINQESFAEEANAPVGVREAYEGDAPLLPGFANTPEVEVVRNRPALGASVNCARGSLTQFGIPMMFVVETFKDPQFASQMGHGTEVLRAKEALVVGVVKSLDDTVAPRLALGDKDNLDPEMETEPDQETEAPGKAIRSSEGEFIIDL